MDEQRYRVEQRLGRWCVINPQGVTLATGISLQDAENIAWLLNMANGENWMIRQREAMGS